MSKYLIADVTVGVREIGIERIVEAFGIGDRPDVPTDAFEAQIVSEPGQPIEVVWRCYATKEIIEKLAPEIVPKNGGFKEYRKA